MKPWSSSSVLCIFIIFLIIRIDLFVRDYFSSSVNFEFAYNKFNGKWGIEKRVCIREMERYKLLLHT